MEQEFNEGEEYELDDLPESEMTHSGKLELIGDGKLAGVYDDQYVTFEWGTVRCTNVVNKSKL